MVNDDALLRAFDRQQQRYYGKYRGTVTDVDDSTMRIKANVPAVLGDVATGWCSPCVPYAGDQVGIAFLPEVGSGVWIEFEFGDVSMPIWTGCYWLANQIPSDATATVKAIITVAGHKILLDDDNKTVTITDSNSNKITLSSDGITLERDSQKVVVSDSEVNINDGSLEVL